MRYLDHTKWRLCLDVGCNSGENSLQRVSAINALGTPGARPSDPRFR